MQTVEEEAAMILNLDTKVEFGLLSFFLFLTPKSQLLLRSLRSFVSLTSVGLGLSSLKGFQNSNTRNLCCKVRT